MARPRLHDDGYLAFLRQKPCCICGRVGETEAAHIRIGFYGIGKKPDDKFCTPLCARHHREQHSKNEVEFWSYYLLKPFEIAERFYAEYGGKGGTPRRNKPVKTRKPKEQRAKITQRKNPWPKKPK